MGGVFKLTSSESGEHFPCFKRNGKHKVTPPEMVGSDDLESSLHTLMTILFICFKRVLDTVEIEL